MVSILTPLQINTLNSIAKSDLANKFYFTGGTALSHYYLKHRLSEDLDFFNLNEFNPIEITSVLKSLQSSIGFVHFDYQHSLNRNLYFLHFPDKKVLKIEFTYYPFAQIEKPKMKDGLLIDSAIDIATNKLFTILQTPRVRDYFDLYFLLKKYKYSIPQLRMLAKQKFDWHIDPLMLASQLHKASTLLDDPILVAEKKSTDIYKFFDKEAIKLGSEILSD